MRPRRLVNPWADAVVPASAPSSAQTMAQIALDRSSTAGPVPFDRPPYPRVRRELGRPRLVVHYTRLGAATLERCRRDDVEATFSETPAEDSHAYHDSMLAIWRARERVIVVEQDVVPPDDLSDLWTCSRPWCVHPYDLGYGAGPTVMLTGLGCTKFSETLMRDHPQVIEWSSDPEHVAPYCYRGRPTRNWKQLDTRIAHVLRIELGFEPHVHPPLLIHQHNLVWVKGQHVRP